MSYETGQFVNHVRSDPDFREKLSSAASMSESVRIARDYGFLADASVVRATLRGDHYGDDLDETDAVDGVDGWQSAVAPSEYDVGRERHSTVPG